MIAFAYYLLKVLIVSGLLMGYYWLVLRNKNFHAWNRFYLLAVALASPILPLVKINFWQSGNTHAHTPIRMLQVVNESDVYLEEVMVYSSYNKISAQEWIMYGFIAICLLMLVVMAVRLVNIYRLKAQSTTIKVDDITLVQTNHPSTPFSFFKNIFWNQAIDLNSENGQRKLRHEHAHISELHTHDKIFVNLMLVFFWCNPFYWLMRKELMMIHEFIADKKAVEDGDTAAFAAMLLQSAYPHQYMELSNPFYFSPIKRRIAMIKQNKQKAGYIGRLLAIPLAALLVVAFTFKKEKAMSAVVDNGVRKLQEMVSGKPVSASNLLTGSDAQNSFAKAERKITVVLDAGHGGNDGGAKAADGTLEKDLNLELVKMISQLNKDPNIHIVLTRESDVYQSPREKSNIAQQSNPELFISIHTDMTTEMETEKNGPSVWIARDSFSNSYSSRLFASSLIQNITRYYKEPISPLPMQRSIGIWVLQALKCPSVLIHAGFLNNSNDRNLLKSEEGKEKFAKAVLEAIAAYASQQSNSFSPTKDNLVNPKNYIFNLDGKKYKYADLLGKQITTIEVSVKNGGNDNFEFVANNAKIESGREGFIIIKAASMSVDGQPGKTEGMFLGNVLVTITNKLMDLKSDSVRVKSDSVRVKQDANSVQIMGFVKYSGVYHLKTTSTLKELIARAGGVYQAEDYQVELKREHESDVITKVFKSSDNLEIPLQAGDILWITKDDKQPKMYLRSLIGPDFSSFDQRSVKISEVKNGLAIRFTKPGIQFVSAKVNFTGAGLKAPIYSYVTSSTIHEIDKYLKDVVNGTFIEFRDVKAMDEGGNLITIEDRTFTVVSDAKYTDKIFTQVEQQPQFPGDQSAWKEFLLKNLNASVPLKNKAKPGTYTVIVKFIVDENGKLSDFSIDKSAGFGMDEEVLRVMKLSPDWVPARQNDRVVKAYRKQPVSFQVAEN